MMRAWQLLDTVFFSFYLVFEIQDRCNPSLSLDVYTYQVYVLQLMTINEFIRFRVEELMVSSPNDLSYSAA